MTTEVKKDDPEHGSKEINVRVLTTSGTYPIKGHERVPVIEQIREILKRAASALKIVDFSTWVVKVDGKPVSPDATYASLGLRGEVKLDWGPTEGGGG